MKLFTTVEDRWIYPWGEDKDARVLVSYLNETERDKIKLNVKEKVRKSRAVVTEDGMQRRYQIAYLAKACKQWENFQDSEGNDLPLCEDVISALFELHPVKMNAFFLVASSEFTVDEEEVEKNS